MCAGVRLGFQERSSPVIADTAAAAADVPPFPTRPPEADARADSSAEAATSTQEPRFEPASSRWLSTPIEATRIAWGFAGGERVRGRVGAAVVAGSRDHGDASCERVGDGVVQRLRLR